MNHKLMMAGERVIGNLPYNDRLYNWIRHQSCVGEPIETETFVSDKAVCAYNRLVDEGSIDFEGARILELGTGWHVAEPCFFYLLGAESVHTVDHVRWVDADVLRQTLTGFQDLLPMLEARCGVSMSKLKRRYDAINRSGSVEEMLDSINTTYHVGSLVDTDLGDEFDLFFHVRRYNEFQNTRSPTSWTRLSR
jgi:hypothetical protein